MKKIILFSVALIVSIATCSQTAARRTQGGAAGVPFELKRSVLFADLTLDEYTTSEWDAAYNNVIAEQRYSASGGMIEQVEFTYDENRGLITSKITRDVESRLKNRVSYQHNPQGYLWRENYLDKNGKVVSTLEFTYDGSGNRTSRIIKNRAGDKLAETTYTYDATRRLTNSLTRDFAENAISSTKFTYDAQGNVIKEEVADGNGRLTSTTSYVWRDGQEVRSELASADGKIQLRISSEYGENSELTRKTIENFQGDSKQIMQYEYTFRPARRS